MEALMAGVSTSIHVRHCTRTVHVRVCKSNVCWREFMSLMVGVSRVCACRKTKRYGASLPPVRESNKRTIVHWAGYALGWLGLDLKCWSSLPCMPTSLKL
jgi:hypothetical protein